MASMLCPQCGKLIGVGEERCPFCGAWQPSLYGWAPKLQRLFGGRLDLVSAISATCVALYVLALVLNPSAIFRVRGLFDFLAPSNDALIRLGMTGWPTWPSGWWWTLLTSLYLHGSILHIFFNVMWIRNLGPPVTDVYGPARGFVIFSLAGAVGMLVSNLAVPLGGGGPTVGASGSIFGLLAALLVHARRSGDRSISIQLWQWAAVMFVMGFLMRGVNNFAHAGGFAGGWVAATLMRSSHERRESPAVQILALALIVITLVGFGLSFWYAPGLLSRLRS